MNKTSASVSTTGLLQVALIVLKLCKVIDWPWWVVLIPAWAPIVCAIVVIFVIRRL